MNLPVHNSIPNPFRHPDGTSPYGAYLAFGALRTCVVRSLPEYSYDHDQIAPVTLQSTRSRVGSRDRKRVPDRAVADNPPATRRSPGDRPGVAHRGNCLNRSSKTVLEARAIDCVRWYYPTRYFRSSKVADCVRRSRERSRCGAINCDRRCRRVNTGGFKHSVVSN